MSDAIRFYLDENVNPRIARALRRMEIDALTAVEAGLRTRADSSQWDFAKEQGRILVTSDDDFLRRAAEDADHYGIVYFAKNPRSVGEVVSWLVIIHGVMTPEEMVGQVEFVPSVKREDT